MSRGAKPSNQGSVASTEERSDSGIVCALALASKGFKVFPCKPDKSPYLSNGFKGASTDEGKIRRWWEVWPDALVGVPTGQGLSVLDIDLKGATVEERLAQLPQALPQTRMHVTRSGGRHYVFSDATGALRTRAGLLPGIDTRGKGGYVVWWSDGPPNGDVAPLPKWLVKLAPVPKPESPAPVVSATVAALGWPVVKKQIERELNALDPDIGHDAWYKLGMAIYHESGGSPEGLAMWDGWSAKGKKYRPGECAKRWQSFATTREDTIRWSGATREARSAPGASQEPAGASAPAGLALASDLLDQDFPDPSFIIDGAIKLSPGAWLLAGRPKDGKTWLSMNLACAALTGREYVGCKAPRPGQVIYMSLDDDSQARFVRRLAWMNVSKQEAGGLLVATAVDTAHFESAYDMAHKLLQTYPGVRFMVIDTLGSFRSRDRKDGVYQQEYDELKAINGLAHEYNVCILIVHHFRKGTLDPAMPFESISGTLGLQGGVDGMLVMTRKDYSHPTDSALDERLAALWYRGRDVDEGDIGMRLRDGQWTVMGGASDVLMGDTLREVMAVLRQQPERYFTSREVASEIEGAKWEAVRKALQRAAKRGSVHSSSSGYRYRRPMD
jgi:Bifunctional DNA primase/polymerase, N-terminal/AAA domain/Primase C terminal 2 (PriCT-2)